MRFPESTISSKILGLILLLGLFFPVIVPAQGFEAGTLIVKLRNEEAATLLDNRFPAAENIFDRVYRVPVTDLNNDLIWLKQRSWVEFAEQDKRIQREISAIDPLFVRDAVDLTKQWYLPRIQVHQAWEKTTGAGITIAIVDTGIDARHEDLNDGRVIRGFASYCQVSDPVVAESCLVRVTGDLSSGVNSDDNGHGTIVAGIVGAIANNNLGISGINWNVLLMPIKALDSHGTGLASDVAVGIRWAADNGAGIINLSIGGSGLEGVKVLDEAISYAFSKGVLIVAAAGNDAAETGGDLNKSPVLPVCADGGQNMIIGVAAVDFNDQKARFSNYGSNCIDLSAPGAGTFFDKAQKQGLVSTYYDPTRPGEHNLYVYAVGTSVAAPMVTGVAALAKSAFPDLDVRSLRDRVISSVDNIDNLNMTGCNGNTCVGQIGRGRINALKAVTESTSVPNGTLARDSFGRIYLIERGTKRLLTSFVLSQRFANNTIITTSQLLIDQLPSGSPLPPIDGTLLKNSTNPTVYLVEGGVKRGLSFLAFVSRGFRFTDVVKIDASELESFPVGSDASVEDNVLVKRADQPAVYIIRGGARRLVSFFVFQQQGLFAKTIVTLSPFELAQYPDHPAGFLHAPVDGTLIKGDQVATVYLIEGGVRRGLTLQAFQNRNFQFSQVRVLPQSELVGYELGGDISL